MSHITPEQPTQFPNQTHRKVVSVMRSSATPGPDSAVVAGFPHGLPRARCAPVRAELSKHFFCGRPAARTPLNLE